MIGQKFRIKNDCAYICGDQLLKAELTTFESSAILNFEFR